jgi:hypothetical protein
MIGLVGDCAKTQCYNDGLCHVLQSGRQVCICKEGWAGADCSIDIDECFAGELTIIDMIHGICFRLCVNILYIKEPTI